MSVTDRQTTDRWTGDSIQRTFPKNLMIAKNDKGIAKTNQNGFNNWD